MRILVTGATGLIGSAILARLTSEGHEVTAAVREDGAAARRLPADHFVVIDMATATAEDWRAHLQDVEALINCAGVLQDSPRDSTAAVHVQGATALFEACEKAGVRRVIHFSAMGADRDPPTAFSQSKADGDRDLAARDLDWVILRPSVVVGRAAYGGSALFRGLSALPTLALPAGTGRLQVVQLDDLVRAVIFFLRPDAPSRMALDIAGPDSLSVADIVARYRSWLGWRPARLYEPPSWLVSALTRLGDMVALLGWRPPVRTTAQREMVRGAMGDQRTWVEITGARPTSLADALAAEPASVQERWFAKLYLLKPLAFGTFSAFWIGTGLISLGPGMAIGKALMEEGGAGPLAVPSVVAGALADIAIGVGIAFRRTARPALYAGLVISLFYAVAGTILVPRLWADPLGPMLKIWPIMAFNFMLLAILDDR